MTNDPTRVRSVFAEYRGRERHCFVPAERGRWIKTHVCAAWVDCELCGAPRGNPCHGGNGDGDGFVVAAHRVRKDDYADMLAQNLFTEFGEAPYTNQKLKKGAKTQKRNRK